MLIQFEYWAQFTRPAGNLAFTGNVFRLNFRLSAKRGVHWMLDRAIND